MSAASLGPPPVTLGMLDQAEDAPKRSAAYVPSSAHGAAPTVVRLKGIGSRMSVGGLYSCCQWGFEKGQWLQRADAAQRDVKRLH